MKIKCNICGENSNCVCDGMRFCSPCGDKIASNREKLAIIPRQKLQEWEEEINKIRSDHWYETKSRGEINARLGWVALQMNGAREEAGGE